jgi:transcriptional regulator GlxA family with amidase domain
VQQRRIVFVIFSGFQPLDLVGPHDVFQCADGLSGSYGCQVVAPRPGPVQSSSGLMMYAEHGVAGLDPGGIDTLIVAGGTGVDQACRDPALVDWIAGAGAGARRLASVCSGVFLLAAAGLITGRRVTTHWGRAEQLTREHPELDVDCDPIFIRDGQVWTSAGVTAGMDLALALVEEDHGSRLALQVARQLVLYLRRPGGQSQFSAALSLQLSERQPLRELHSWVLENLARPLTVQTLADHVTMSPRNFARIFRRDMGITPGKFVERLRIETARRRLEETPRSLKRIAQECGFSSVGAMRGVFQRVVGIAPVQYRQHFRSS